MQSNHTIYEHIGGQRRLAVLHFQVLVGTLVLSRLIDSGV